MRTIPALEAQVAFDRMLDEVERGESILISRNGKIVARMDPEPEEAGSREMAPESIPQGLKPD
jgi:antitoxin (DNA-binding transcriptional repressor) of toxin-antitoxin stability system